MSFEIVKRIGIKKDGTISVNSACSNVFPKKYYTWVYDGTIEEIVKHILGNSLSVTSKTKGKFMEYYCMAIMEVAKNKFENDIHNCYKAIGKIVWYLPDWDSEDRKPTEHDIESFNEVVKYIENAIENKLPTNKSKYYLKSKDDYFYLCESPNRNGSYKIDPYYKKPLDIIECVFSLITLPKFKIVDIIDANIKDSEI